MENKKEPRASKSEILSLRREIESLRVQLADKNRLQDRLTETLQNLEIHQEELRTQNEELRLSQRELARTSERYQILFRNAPVGYFLLDQDGVIVDANVHAATLLNRKLGDLMGRPLAFFLSPEDVSCFERHFGTVAEGRPDSIEVSVSLPRGRELPVILDTAPLKGETWRSLASMVDISRIKQAEAALKASESRFRALFEQSPMGTQILGTDGTMVGVNSAWQQLWNIPREAVKGINALEEPRLQPLDIPTVLRAAVSGKTADIQPFQVDTGAAVKWLRSVVYPIRSENDYIREVIVMHEDVTERKLADERLEIALEDLTRSNQELQQFAYVASHDLQEPLRMIITYLQLLEMRYGSVLDADALEFLGFAVDGAKRLRALVRDLLAFSRVESKAMPFVSVDLNEVVELVRHELQSPLSETGAILIAEDMPEIRGDRNQIVQLFSNIVGNSIKYRDPERPPSIRISSANAGNFVSVSVQDNGIGISPEYFQKIFQIFQRINVDPSREGTGIGLAICRKIVERHGGSIWVESLEGQGATFRFSLPFRKTGPER